MKRLLAFALCISVALPSLTGRAEMAAADTKAQTDGTPEGEEDPVVEGTLERLCREQMRAKEGELSRGAFLYLLRHCVRSVNLEKEKAKKLQERQAKRKKTEESRRAYAEKFRKASSRRLIQQTAQRDRFRALKEMLKTYRRVRPRERLEKVAGTGSTAPRVERGIRGAPQTGTGGIAP